MTGHKTWPPHLPKPNRDSSSSSNAEEVSEEEEVPSDDATTSQEGRDLVPSQVPEIQPHQRRRRRDEDEKDDQPIMFHTSYYAKPNTTLVEEVPAVIDDEGDDPTLHELVEMTGDQVAAEYTSSSFHLDGIEADVALRFPDAHLIQRKRRQLHFITCDAPADVPIKSVMQELRVRIKNAHAYKIIRYATWCIEVGHSESTSTSGIPSNAVWGHEHIHIYVECYRPISALALVYILFGRYLADIDNQHVFVQPVRDRFRAKNYVAKAETKLPGTTHGEYGIWKNLRWLQVNRIEDPVVRPMPQFKLDKSLMPSHFVDPVVVSVTNDIGRDALETTGMLGYDNSYVWVGPNGTEHVVVIN